MKFINRDEKIVWAKFAAAAIGADCAVHVAAKLADDLVGEMRKRQNWETTRVTSSGHEEGSP